MKTLHLYLARQVLATVALTVTVFTFVLLLGNGLKDIIELLVHQQATLWLVIQSLGLLIPWVLLFALPMGMLTATLLVFGRFSADQELTAVRASGISLVALVTPVLLLALAFSGLCAWINMEIAPQCRVAYKNLLYQMAMANPVKLLRENQYNDFPGGWSIYARKIDKNELRGVKVYQVNEKENSLLCINARSGKFVAENDQLLLTLYDADASEVRDGNVVSRGNAEEFPQSIPTKSSNKSPPKISLSDMTFSQLQAQLRQLESSLLHVSASTNTTSALLRAELRQMEKLRKDVTLPVRVQLHRQVAFSFACIGFTLIGIPLGIRAHRRETSVGIAISLLLVLLYYSFIILAQSWDTRPEFAPHLIVWLPNFIFQIVGGVLLWRANKGIS
ncbi:MAG: LptF/LptG family permease [Verrucomicrobiota bacterium]